MILRDYRRKLFELMHIDPDQMPEHVAQADPVIENLYHRGMSLNAALGYLREHFKQLERVNGSTG